MLLRRRREESSRIEHRPPVSGPITLVPIGHVVNGRARPQPRGWERVTSTIRVATQYIPLLSGIEGYSHLIVVVYLDLAAGATEKPVTLPADGRAYGLFATRSQLRPNHLGVSVVALEAVDHERGELRVKGLDAIDGTAVVDMKPYLPEYDAIPSARIPGARE